MATQKKAADVDYSMQEKIMALYEIQKIDSKIDEINKVKGELPLEVQDLEDELAGLKTRIDNVNAEIEEFNALTKQRKREIDQAKIQIANYKEQQNNVRNNREFDAITKEIEYQELEIELAEKRLKEYAAGVKVKKAQLEETEAVLNERSVDLTAKKSELESIEAETAPQVAEYEAQAEQARAKVDERLLAAYNRIRRSVRNGLAVVTVKRDACGGCFNRIPPQRQVDIRSGKKIIICEYCGRILVAAPAAELSRNGCRNQLRTRLETRSGGPSERVRRSAFRCDGLRRGRPLREGCGRACSRVAACGPAAERRRWGACRGAERVFAADCLPFVGRLSADCRPNVGWLARCRPGQINARE